MASSRQPLVWRDLGLGGGGTGAMDFDVRDLDGTKRAVI
jgi:hypothetical protein